MSNSNDIILAYLMAHPSVTTLTLSELGQVLQLETKRFWTTVEVSEAGAKSPNLEAYITVDNGDRTFETGWRVVLG